MLAPATTAMLDAVTGTYNSAFNVTAQCAFGGVLLINLSGGGLGGGFTLLGDGAVLLAARANGCSISLF